MQEPQQRGIRALHTASTITVYQAYSPEIGLPAARDGRFPAGWKRDRMTWVTLSCLGRGPSGEHRTRLRQRHRRVTCQALVHGK
jgi:hypothetical protein